MPISTKGYSRDMLELLDIYYESRACRKYNWFDFLKELQEIIFK
jgi:hypothetical protein